MTNYLTFTRVSCSVTIGQLSIYRKLIQCSIWRRNFYWLHALADSAHLLERGVCNKTLIWRCNRHEGQDWLITSVILFKHLFVCLVTYSIVPKIKLWILNFFILSSPRTSCARQRKAPTSRSQILVYRRNLTRISRSRSRRRRPSFLLRRSSTTIRSASTRTCGRSGCSPTSCELLVTSLKRFSQMFLTSGKWTISRHQQIFCIWPRNFHNILIYIWWSSVTITA